MEENLVVKWKCIKAVCSGYLSKGPQSNLYLRSKEQSLFTNIAHNKIATPNSFNEHSECELVIW
jgi:hypothetical protein